MRRSLEKNSIIKRLKSVNEPRALKTLFFYFFLRVLKVLLKFKKRGRKVIVVYY